MGVLRLLAVSEAILPLCLGALAGQDGLMSLGLSHLTVHCNSVNCSRALIGPFYVSVPKVPNLALAEQMPQSNVHSNSQPNQEAFRIILDFSEPFTRIRCQEHP